MPYITSQQKENLADGFRPSNAGQLNYVITMACKDYLMERVDSLGRSNNYEDYNSVIGALESCKLEFYRRMVATYEDKKIYENGDVF